MGHIFSYVEHDEQEEIWKKNELKRELHYMLERTRDGWNVPIDGAFKTYHIAFKEGIAKKVISDMTDEEKIILGLCVMGELSPGRFYSDEEEVWVEGWTYMDTQIISNEITLLYSAGWRKFRDFYNFKFKK